MCAPDYFYGVVKTALEYKESAFMFFTGAPQNNKRAKISVCKITEGLELLKENGFDANKIIVHAPYLINLGNTFDEFKFNLSVDFLISEVNRANAFRAKIIVLHPGYSLGADRDKTLKQISKGIDLVLEKCNNDVIIAIETMSGKGSEVGNTFEDIAKIISFSKNKNKLGVCIDTCHMNDAGFVLDNIDEILDDFDKIIGLQYLKVIHLNDSKNEISSHKDRHENIGFGTIGFDVLLKYVYHPKLKDIPKILETPYVNECAPYKFEIDMIKSKVFDQNIKEKIN